MDISVQSYDVYLNGKFFADRMLNQKNISTYEFSEGYDENINKEHKAVLITVIEPADKDKLDILIDTCFESADSLKVIDNTIKDYEKTLNHVKNDKDAFYDTVWFQTFGLGDNGPEIQFFRFAHKDYKLSIPSEPEKNLILMNVITKVAIATIMFYCLQWLMYCNNIQSILTIQILFII